MIKYLLDTGQKKNVTLFFSNRTPADIVYKDIFDQAEKVGVKIVYAVGDLTTASLTSNMRVGFINADMIMKEVPDYKNCYYYLSGPRSMVLTFEDTLSKIGVAGNHIKTDFFPGYV